MTKKIKWRLGTLPTPDELRNLVIDKLITKEEAREILFHTEEVQPKTDDGDTKSYRDAKSYQAEIIFLREIIQKLSTNSTQLVQILTPIQKVYRDYAWYGPYGHWVSTVTPLTSGFAGTAGNNLTGFATANNTALVSGATGNVTGGVSGASGFTSIKTF